MEKIGINENKNPGNNKKIKLYKNIFGEEPWGEGFICKNCDNIFNKKFMGQCNCGKSKLESFYNNRELKQEFSKLSNKDGYKELVANILEEQIGFIWGWNTNLEELNNDKLSLNDDNLNKLYSDIKKHFSDFDINNFYYFAEIGVNNKYRGKDIAGKLYRENLNQLKLKGEKFILVRTTKKTDIPYKWLKKEGYIDVYNYNDNQDRVVLVYKI